MQSKCETCAGELAGRQRKFCSRKCKNASTNFRHQTYCRQQARGVARKRRLVAEHGGGCTRCGYRRNYAALEWHHVVPSSKAFNLDLRALSNRRFAVILAEIEKCVLLCANCHADLHNPKHRIEESRMATRGAYGGSLRHCARVSSRMISASRNTPGPAASRSANAR